jgi:hypothetical protein
MAGHVTPNFFGSVLICGLCSALRCVWGVKQRRTIFLARVAPVRIPQKMHRDTLCQTCVFYPVVSAGHVVHFGTSGLVRFP